MALPNPISSHVDCIRIGGPGAQRGGQRLLIISLAGEMVQEKYLEWWAGLLQPPRGEQRPLFKKKTLQSLFSVLASDWLWIAVPKVYTLHRWYDLHFIYLHQITPTCIKRHTGSKRRQVTVIQNVRGVHQHLKIHVFSLYFIYSDMTDNLF